MRKIKNIIVSRDIEPSRYDLWIKNKAIKIYGDNGWEDLIPDISNTLTKDSADKLYQPKGSYLTSVPAATSSKIGGIKKGSAIADTDVSEAATVATVGATVNAILAQMRASGIINN